MASALIKYTLQPLGLFTSVVMVKDTSAPYLYCAARRQREESFPIAAVVRWTMRARSIVGTEWAGVSVKPSGSEAT